MNSPLSVTKRLFDGSNFTEINEWMKKLFYFLLLLSLVQVVDAQEDSGMDVDRLHTILKPTDSSIMLRWAPSDAGLWLQMHRARIVVERSSWIPGAFAGEIPVLISDTIRMWDEAAYDSYLDNELVMLVGYCIHAPYESLTKEGKKLSLMANQEKELANRFSSALFAAERDVTAAKAQALFYEDTSVDVSLRSMYTIKMYIDEQIFTSHVYYDPADDHAIQPVISNWEEEEQTVVISWDKDLHEAHFSSYYIERSSDGRSYTRLTDKPYVHAFDMNEEEQDGDFVFVDSVQNYVPYHYRIVGLDAFGQESEPSATVLLMGKDKTPPKPASQTSAIMHRDQYMKVKWEITDPEVSKIGIKRSHVYDGTYTIISNVLSPSDTIFFDFAPDYMGSNFYKVCVYDTAYNEACTIPIYGNLNDTIPPAPPTGIVGKIDTNGVVQFSWNRNQEIDVLGYKIFFSNRYDGVYSVLTNEYIRDTVYIDTISLSTLTEDIFYRVVAADVRDNVSNFSQFTQIRKPDILPPGPSVFATYEAKDNFINLTWNPSATHDVVTQHLYRKSEKESEWNAIATFGKEENQYRDTALGPNLYYQYRIIAEDNSGLTSKTARDVMVQSPLRPKVTELALSFIEEGGGRTGRISAAPQSSAIDKVVLYKEVSGIRSTEKVLKPSDLPYEFSVGQEDYSIRVYYSDGQKSGYYSALSED